MPDPLTLGTAGLAGVTTTATLLKNAQAIVQSIKALVPDDGQVPEHVLRTVYLDTEINLRILAVLPASGGRAGTDSAYFAYASLLRTESLMALLLEWPREKSYDLSGLFRRQRNWEKQARELEEQTLLALARKVLVASQALQAISSVPPEARNKTQIRRRLLNVKTWLQMLAFVLRSHPDLEPVTHKI